MWENGIVLTSYLHKSEKTSDNDTRINKFIYFFLFIFDYGFFIRILWIISNKLYTYIYLYILLNLDCCRHVPPQKNICDMFIYTGSEHLLIEFEELFKLKMSTLKLNKQQRWNDISVSFEFKVVVVWQKGKPKNQNNNQNPASKFPRNNRLKNSFRKLNINRIYFEFIPNFNVCAFVWYYSNRTLNEIFFSLFPSSIITSLIFIMECV